MKRSALSLLTVLFFAAATASNIWSAPAEGTVPQATAPAPDKPARVDARVTPISVVLEGTDSIGARLGTKLKETFNSSNLFHLTEKDTPKMRLLVSTSPEFPSRPGIASVYSVCWVFSQGEGYLSFLLSRELGTVNSEDIDGLVAQLVEKTDGLSVKYASLLKDAKK